MSLLPGPEEVAVEGVREPSCLDGGRGGEQALRRHLPAEEGAAWPVVGVAATEEVLVDPFQSEERTQVVGEIHAQECPGRHLRGKWADASAAPVG